MTTFFSVYCVWYPFDCLFFMLPKKGDRDRLLVSITSNSDDDSNNHDDSDEDVSGNK